MGLSGAWEHDGAVKSLLLICRIWVRIELFLRRDYWKTVSHMKQFLSWQRIIPIIAEGEVAPWGPHFRKDIDSLVDFGLILPVWLYPSSKYWTLEDHYLREGRRLLNWGFHIRINKWWLFPGRKRVIFEVAKWRVPYNAQIVSSRQRMMEK